jgi:cell wall integrity and stress response component
MEPQTSVQTVTEGGAVVTRTVIQTPVQTPSASSAPVRTDNGDGGSNVGAIAGGVAGGVIGLLAIAGGLLFFLWRRRKQQREAQENGNGGSSGGITRNTSTMSKAGLLGGGTEMEHQYPARIATNFSTQNSRYGADQDSISPISNRRNSQPLMIDSRLNPNAVMTFAGANLSRDSVASLDDSRDYGRQLNVRNPDQ